MRIILATWLRLLADKIDNSRNKDDIRDFKNLYNNPTDDVTTEYLNDR